MLIRMQRDGDRYIVFGREGGSGEERIGFVRQDGKWWNAVDTFMDKSHDFPRRADAIDWLKKLAAK